jgi:hypothetical protein
VPKPKTRGPARDRGAFLSWCGRRLRLLRIAWFPPDDSLPTSSREPLGQVLSPDGQFRLTLHRRADGRFGYSVDRCWVEEIPEHGLREEYWAPHHCSGLFDSADSALRDAALQFPWIAPAVPD